MTEQSKSEAERLREAEEQSAYYAREHARFMAAFKATMARFAKGNFESGITETVIDEYKDIVGEINMMAAAFNTYSRATDERHNRQREAVQVIGNALRTYATGNLDVRIEADLGADFEPLKVDFNNTVTHVTKLVRRVSESVATVNHATNEISQASDDLSRRTEQQAASLEETVAVLDEITTTVRQTATGAKRARDLVASAKTSADRSNSIVQETVSAINRVEASSRKISEIISVMNEIAFQTNLLALNAGVEAARAGESGRGFAVIASEVRALAQRSSTAAREIRGHIEASSAQVAQGVSLVANSGKALEDIASKVAEINGVIVDIATSAQEQAKGLTGVNSAISQMDKVTQQNAAMAEKATAAAQALSEESQALAQLVQDFEAGNGSSETRRLRVVATRAG